MWVGVVFAAACGPFEVQLEGKVDASDSGAPAESGVDGSTDGVPRGEPCAGPGLVEVWRTVDLEAQTASCPWWEGDNLGPQDLRVTARRGTTEALLLPVDGRICGIEVAAEGWEVPWGPLYDDQFLLTVGGVVVASSDAELVDALGPGADGLRRYDWAALVGRSFAPSETRPWCLGATPDTDCSVPDSTWGGDFVLPRGGALEPALVDALGAQPEVALVVVGDDDQDSDCAHASLRVRVGLELRY